MTADSENRVHFRTVVQSRGMLYGIGTIWSTACDMRRASAHACFLVPYSFALAHLSAFLSVLAPVSIQYKHKRIPYRSEGDVRLAGHL